MKKSYRIENIDCANCAEKLQNSLKKISLNYPTLFHVIAT